MKLISSINRVEKYRLKKFECDIFFPINLDYCISVFIIKMRLAFYIIENQLQSLDNMIIYSPWDMDDANGLKLVQYNLDWFLIMHREDRAL